MTAEVAVGELQHFFQVVEIGEVRLRQDRQYPQPILLVDDFIESPGRVAQSRRAQSQSPTAAPALANVKVNANTG